MKTDIIIQGSCVDKLASLPDRSVDLVFSINFKYALPTITASAPALMYLFTSSGVDTPNPIPTGILPFVCFFTFFRFQGSEASI